MLLNSEKQFSQSGGIYIKANKPLFAPFLTGFIHEENGS